MKRSKEQFTKDEELSLRRSVQQFNRKIRRLRSERNKTWIPDEVDYKYIKDRILTKNELEKYITELQNFTNTRVKYVTLKSGQKITEWEFNLLEERRKRALRRMNKALKPLKEKTLRSQGDIDLIDVLEGNKQKLKNFQKVKDTKELLDIRRKIMKIGDSEYNLRKAHQYRVNFMKTFEELKNFEFYEVFKKKLDSISSDFAFYEYIKRSRNLTDLFVYYKGDVIIGAYNNNEEMFNETLENVYGYDLEEIRENRRKSGKDLQWSAVDSSGWILSSSNSKKYLQSLYGGANVRYYKNY